MYLIKQIRLDEQISIDKQAGLELPYLRFKLGLSLEFKNLNGGWDILTGNMYLA